MAGPSQFAYSQSAGGVLRFLGEMLEGECEVAVDHNLANVIALKVARETPP
jgi:hypothetical protein